MKYKIYNSLFYKYIKSINFIVNSKFLQILIIIFKNKYNKIFFKLSNLYIRSLLYFLIRKCFNVHQVNQSVKNFLLHNFFYHYDLSIEIHLY